MVDNYIYKMIDATFKQSLGTLKGISSVIRHMCQFWYEGATKVKNLKKLAYGYPLTSFFKSKVGSLFESTNNTSAHVLIG